MSTFKVNFVLRDGTSYQKTYEALDIAQDAIDAEKGNLAAHIVSQITSPRKPKEKRFLKGKKPMVEEKKDTNIGELK